MANPVNWTDLLAKIRRYVRERQEQGESSALFQKPLVAEDLPRTPQTTVLPTPKPLRVETKAPAIALPESASQEWRQLAEAARQCTACVLARTRQHVVLGEGDPHASLVFVGEAPGAEEDRTGLPFAGEAGNLLTKIIESISLKREQVYICNILKCRPPGNRNPEPQEIAACRLHLERQLSLLQPKLIVALGTFAAQTLLATGEPIGKLRGKVHHYKSIPLITTFHPAALLYHPQNKKLAWQDMLLVAKQLGLKPVTR